MSRLSRLMRRALLVLVLCPVLGVASAQASPPSYTQRQDVQRFITAMVERHGFVRAELAILFAKVKFQPAIIKAITPPVSAPARSWLAYRQLFVNAQRIEAGQRFRERHAESLARAQSEFGIPQEIIVAIIGVETVYGRNMGSHRVIDALATLAFDYPPRAEFFLGELEQFLLMARDAGFNILAIKGSYAGAIGIPQFMPGSYRRFAVDYDGDGQAHLSDSPVDAIGSVANFLREHGWARGEPVAFTVRMDQDKVSDAAAVRRLANAGIKPSIRVADLEAHGLAIADPPPTLPPETLVTLVELESVGLPTEYRIGLQNFYALTRYNRSSHYATAVFDLAEAIGGPGSRPGATSTRRPFLALGQ